MSTLAVEVPFPTQTIPSYEQCVIGKKSPLTPDLEEFRGIPFGYVPGRWRHSELRTSLPSERYDASHNGTFQSHIDFPADVTESEFECLNLFIIRPSREALSRLGKENENLPVLIWIHGGAFGFGAGTDPMWDPSRLVLESFSLGTPFIAVCLNYRLNLFGFAASSELLDDQTCSSRKGCNFGLRDQQVGIQWVSRNIRHFGGDPTKITLGGQSAGAASTHTHTLAAVLKPETPLFRRSIFQSGSLGCLGPAPFSEANANWDRLCQHLGFEKEGSISRLESLRTLPTDELLRAQKDLGWMAFPVIIDGESFRAIDAACEVLLDLDGRPRLGDGQESSREPIEILLGDTEAESSIFAREIQNIRTFDQVKAVFVAEFSSPTTTEDILNAYHINTDTPINTLHDQLFHFVSDVMFGLPLFKARKFFTSAQTENNNTKSSTNPIYYHLATVKSYKVKFGNPFPGPSHNVSHHCVELIYLFDAFHDDLVKIDSIEHSLADQLTPPLDDKVHDNLSQQIVPVHDISALAKKRSNIALQKDIQRHGYISLQRKKGKQKV